MNTEILQFLKELSANNNREWFQENKKRYDVLHKVFLEEIQELIEGIALFDQQAIGLQAKDCQYRIYRDLRFSPDKTPYKTHFGAYIALGGRASERAGYYFHLQPDGCVLAGGVWCPQPKLLKMLRQDIYDNMDEFVEIIEKPSFKASYVMEGEMLKRMPVGYPSDLEHGEVLRYKDYSFVAYKPDTFFTAADWKEQTLQCFKELLPVNNFLNYTVDEFLE